MDVKELKAKLTHGDITRISERLQIASCTVSAVLLGKKQSKHLQKIIDTSIDIITERKNKERESIDRLNRVLSE